MSHILRRLLRARRRKYNAQRELNAAVAGWCFNVREARGVLDRERRNASQAQSRLAVAESNFVGEVRYWSVDVASHLDVWLTDSVPGWVWKQSGDVVIGHVPTSVEPGGQSIEVGIEPTDDGGFKWFAVSVRWRVVHGTGESIREALAAMLRSLTEPVPYDDAWPDLAPLVELLREAVESLAVSSVDAGDASPAADTAPRRPRGPGGRFAARDPAPPDGGGS